MNDIDKKSQSKIVALEDELKKVKNLIDTCNEMLGDVLRLKDQLSSVNLIMEDIEKKYKIITKDGNG